MQQKILTKNEIIDLIHDKDVDDFYLDLSRDKNKETLEKYDISVEDAIGYVKELTVNHYDRREKCDDSNFNIDYWYIFHLVTFIDSYDGFSDRVRLFIRIGLFKDSVILCIRSFHEDDW